MSFTLPLPGAAAIEYQKVLTFYTAGDTVGAAREAIKNINQPFCPRYFQVKNLIVVGTLIEDEVHSLHYFTMAGEVHHSLIEDMDGSSAAEQMIRALGQEIAEAEQRREMIEGPAELGEKAFTVVDHSVLGVMPELDVSLGLREHIKPILAFRTAAENEVASLRQEIAHIGKDQAKFAGKLAWERAQVYQQTGSNNRRGLNGYASLMLNFFVVCCVLIMFFFGRTKGIF